MKRFSVILATLGSLLLIFILVFTMLQVVMNDETFVNNTFTNLGVARKMNMSNADLVNSTMRLVDYMEGRVDSIDILVSVNGEKVQMFELEQEHTHMADVRTLYQSFRTGRDLGILLMLVLFLLSALLGFRNAPRTLASGFLWGAFVAMLFFGFIGTWAALDFSSFWTFFHQMLFWNEDWLFDTATSRMINMLPEEFFSAIIGRMAAFAAASFALLVGISILTLVADSRKRRKAREAALKKKQERLAKEAQRASGEAGTVAKPKRKRAVETEDDV